MTQNGYKPRLIPTGSCWCGCGKETSIGAFFAQGHDKLAEAALIAIEYNDSVAQLLHRHGYGPQHSLVDKAVREGSWIKCDECWYAGRPQSVQSHQRKYHSKK